MQKSKNILVFLRESGGLLYLRGKKTPVPAHSLLTEVLDPLSKTPALILEPLGLGTWFCCCACSVGHADWGKPRGRAPLLPLSYPLVLLTLLWVCICGSLCCWVAKPTFTCCLPQIEEHCGFITCWNCQKQQKNHTQIRHPDSKFLEN